MTAPARPPAVTRYLRRPLWWALGVGVFVLLEVLGQARIVAADAPRYAEVFTVAADASPAHPDSGVIDVRYTDPVSGATVVAAMKPEDGVTRRSDGRLDIEVSRTDPTAVRPAGQRRELSDDVPFLAVLALMPYVSYGLRRAHVRRLERLMASDRAAYAMVAATRPPDRLHRSWRLFLYPIDARAGADPVCAVELVWMPVLPDGAFPVEVKGDPRSFGVVAVRSGDEVLWPRGRGLATRATLARPERLGPTLAPATAIGMASSDSVPHRRPSLWPSRLLRIGGLVGLAVFMAVARDATWNDDQALGRSRPADARIEAVSLLSSTVQVSYRRGDQEERAVVQLDVATPVAVGDTLAVRYDVTQVGRAWVATRRGPPDAAADLAITVTLGLAGAGLILAWLVRRQELARLGVYELSATGRVELGTLPLDHPWPGELP